MIIAFNNGDIEDVDVEKSLKCYITCRFEEQGILGDGGEIVYATIQTGIDELEETERGMLQMAHDSCQDITAAGECEMAYAIAKCHRLLGSHVRLKSS